MKVKILCNIYNVTLHYCAIMLSEPNPKKPEMFLSTHSKTVFDKIQ